MLSLVVSQNWVVHQLDVKNAFLHDTLEDTVYCAQPSRFVDSLKPDFVCRFNKSLYGLKQAPRVWYIRFAFFLCSIGFLEAKLDTSLFILRRGSNMAYLLLYIDDIILTASSESVLHSIVSSLAAEFSMKDLGQLHHFLGMTVSRSSTRMFLS